MPINGWLSWTSKLGSGCRFRFAIFLSHPLSCQTLGENRAPFPHYTTPPTVRSVSDEQGFSMTTATLSLVPHTTRSMTVARTRSWSLPLARCCAAALLLWPWSTLRSARALCGLLVKRGKEAAELVAVPGHKRCAFVVAGLPPGVHKARRRWRR